MISLSTTGYQAQHSHPLSCTRSQALVPELVLTLQYHVQVYNLGEALVNDMRVHAPILTPLSHAK